MAQGQLLGRLKAGSSVRLAIDKTVQKIEDVGLGGNTCIQCQFDCAEDCLLVVLKDQCQDLRHLPVAASTLEEVALKLPERIGHLRKRGTIAQGSGLALDDCQVVPPVIDGSTWQMMGAPEDTFVFAEDLPLGGDDDPFRIDPQADRPVDPFN